jgi:cytochrome c553
MISRLLPLSAVALALAAQGSAVAQEIPAPPPEIAEAVALCATCHGEDGRPVVEKVPIIWGQHLFYIMIQLRDYRAGRRTNELMGPIAAQLSDDDIKALAAYFSGLPWPSYREPAGSDEVARALSLETQGQCSQCHLGAYKGNSDVPRVGNQKADYTEQTLRDYRDGIRMNSPPMAALVEGWSDEDVVAMAHYLAGL